MSEIVSPTQARDGEILEAAVRAHIATARPVSSDQLRNGKLGALSPATVRARLAVLEEEGFLQKPHTSAGRVPTEQGYRYFVAKLEERYYSVQRDMQLLRERQVNRLLERFTEDLHLVAGITDDKQMIRTKGFDQLFEEPEFASQEFVVQFGKLFNALPEIIVRERRAREMLPHQVLVGKIDAFPGIERLSMIISAVEDGNVFFAIGPTRMDYEKAMKLLIDNEL